MNLWPERHWACLFTQAIMQHISHGLHIFTGKNNRFPFLDILGYLKNTHKNPKFGKVRQVPIRELGWEFPGWDLSHFAKFGIFMVFFKYPKISKNGNPLFFPVAWARFHCLFYCSLKDHQATHVRDLTRTATRS